jgi:hypothetical protein
MSYARTLIKLRELQTNSAESLAYGNDSSTTVNVRQALDWIFAVLYPKTQDSVATTGDLPLVGNELNDYRIVQDDGDGKAAGYRWESREGDVAPSWYKIHDMDWSSDAILASFLDITQELYVQKRGRQDLDASGDPVTGLFAGQSIYGGTDAGSSLTLNANAGDPSDAPADQTGYIQFNDDARPTYDDSFDLGTITERFRNLLLSGSISDGTNSLTVIDLQDAYDHSEILSGNPHSTSYDVLASKLGTLTVDGDASGSVDLSSSGNKTLTLMVANDSHTHDAASTIINFDSEVYEYLKVALQDNAEVTWIFDDALETIDLDVTVSTGGIDDVEPPLANNILVGKTDSTEWIARPGLIELTGDVTGSGSFNSTGYKWDIALTVENTPLATVDRIVLDNKTFTSAAGTPTTITATAHGLRNGETVRIFGSSTINGQKTVTVVDANTFTIPDTTAGAESGYYIPQGGQLLFDTSLDAFKVAKEFEEIRLGELSGLDEDVLLQYVAKDGRSGGQTVNGGVSASENLTLESTTNATKGSILAKSNFTPFTTAAYSGGWTGTDLGSSSKRWNDLYLAGEAKGLRVENVGSLPTPSGTEIGRLVYFSGNVYHNNGTTYTSLAGGGGGSSSVSVSTKTTNYTVVLADDVILCNGTLTITLLPSGSYNKRLTIKNIGTGIITIDGDGTETIDGSLTQLIYDQYHSFTLVPDGTNWHII